ncbi:MAG TPA: hypothetical protein VOA64_09085 [Candidatus Dormibacteraeota bacterium]|nr:hypothetical protein [Candidatus Dormibacteraeota bacterium]
MSGPRDSLVLSYVIYSHRGEYPDIKELQNLATPERRKAAFLAQFRMNAHPVDRARQPFDLDLLRTANTIPGRIVADSETIPAPCGSSSSAGGHLDV